MTNQEMIEQLKDKLNTWTPEWIQSYDDSNDPNVLVCPKKVNLLVWDNNGYYEIYRAPDKWDVVNEVLVSNQRKITYTNCVEGHTYSLAQNFDNNGWYLYQKLYLDGVNTGQFRIDVPLAQELVDVNGETWEYTRVMRPGLFTGNTPWFNSKEEIELFFTSCVNDYYNLLQSALRISKEHDTKGIPAIGIKHRLTDNTGGYYFKNVDLWDKTVPFVVNQSLALVTYLLTDFVKREIILQEFADTCITNATSKWSSING